MMLNKLSKSKYIKILFGSRRGRCYRDTNRYFKSGMRAGYIGFLGHGNVGDEMLFDSIQMLFNDIDLISRNAQLPIEMLLHDACINSDRDKFVMLGGGTLIFNDHYLKSIEEALDSALPVIIFGSGVRDIEFWQKAQWGKDSVISINRWVHALNSASFVGVRGPRSYKTLVDAGVKNVIEVGDPALFYPENTINKDESYLRNNRRLVVNLGANGPILGAREHVYTEMLHAVKQLISEGWHVTLVPFHKTDMQLSTRFATDLNNKSLEIWPNYHDVARTIQFVRDGDLVICQRLHCAVAAASIGKIPIALAYRPKIFDFMESMGIPQYAIPTESVSADSIIQACYDVIKKSSELKSLVLQRKEQYQECTNTAVRKIHELINN